MQYIYFREILLNNFNLVLFKFNLIENISFFLHFFKFFIILSTISEWLTFVGFELKKKI